MDIIATDFIIATDLWIVADYLLEALIKVFWNVTEIIIETLFKGLLAGLRKMVINIDWEC